MQLSSRNRIYVSRMLSSRRWRLCVTACLAALSVFTVLVTAAFDDLPCTAAHSAHTFAVPVAVVLASILLILISKPLLHAGRVIAGTDLLLVTCSRLC
jgi:hypothetical protein